MFYEVIFLATISCLFIASTLLWFVWVPKIIIRSVVVQLTQELLVRDDRLDKVKNAIGRALITNETALDPENLDEEIGFIDEELGYDDSK